MLDVHYVTKNDFAYTNVTPNAALLTSQRSWYPAPIKNKFSCKIRFWPIKVSILSINLTSMKISKFQWNVCLAWENWLVHLIPSTPSKVQIYLYKYYRNIVIFSHASKFHSQFHAGSKCGIMDFLSSILLGTGYFSQSASHVTPDAVSLRSKLVRTFFNTFNFILHPLP